MVEKKKEHPLIKENLHDRNKHRERYDFKLLIATSPELGEFVFMNEYGDETIDFFNPLAVLMLNKTLLKHYYGISNWSIPQNYLCPPIPGRADYIHYIADLLGSSNNGKIPKGNQIKCLDIGIGANCIYPIIGVNEYGWSFVGSDINPVSIASATNIVDNNPILQGMVEIELQTNPSNIFYGIIQKDERFDITISNPPFHSSAEEAEAGSIRKLSNLKQKTVSEATLNFGGQVNELWCEGGEYHFIQNMIRQSKQFAKSCLWFTTLVSKHTNLNPAYNELKKVEAVDVKTIPMAQGNKVSRVLAWTFCSAQQQIEWVNSRWGD